MVIQKMLFQNKLYFSPVTNHHERSFQFFLACEAVPVNEHNVIYLLLSRRHNKITEGFITSRLPTDSLDFEF